jgi:hypothetical protein
MAGILTAATALVVFFCHNAPANDYEEYMATALVFFKKS